MSLLTVASLLVLAVSLEAKSFENVRAVETKLDTEGQFPVNFVENSDILKGRSSNNGSYEASPVFGYHEAVGVAAAARIQQQESSNTAVGRIVGGLGSYLGEHPFFGGLVITLKSGATSVCGSSLVTATRVLTTAHCWWDGVDTAYSMLVVLGSTTLFSGGTRVYASVVSSHASYIPGLVTNDIAVLTIPAVAFGSYVKPIAVASGSNNYVGYTAEAIGFGRTSDSASITTSASLRDVFVPVISNSECAAVYGSIVTSGVICTSGSGARGVCGGDSGGSLILKATSGNDLLIGLINFQAAAGCQASLPSGYVRVTYHYNWILNQL